MKREGLLLGGLGLATLLIVVAAAFFLSGPSQTQKTNETKVTDTALLLGPEDGRQAFGTPSAKVTIVEFGDFQCPACGAAFPIVKRIKEAYKDNVYFVFRNFPLPQHQNASFAAEATYAALKQGKFWELHDKLYESQEEWGEKGNASEIITNYAKDLGLDMTALHESVNKKAGNSKIQKDQNDGYQLGVNSTPTFFINGEKFTGVLPYDQFKKLIDDRLK